LDQDVAIKVYFDGDYNAMTLTECKKEVCIISSLCYELFLEVTRTRQNKSVLINNIFRSTLWRNWDIRMCYYLWEQYVQKKNLP